MYPMGGSVKPGSKQDTQYPVRPQEYWQFMGGSAELDAQPHLTLLRHDA